VTQLVQALILGLLLGGVYALAASGLTLVFGVMHIINVAHGALLILAAYLTWEIWHRTGIDPIAVSVITMPIMFVFGWILYQLTIRRIQGGPPSMSVLMTFGIALALAGLSGVIWSNDFKSVTPGYFNKAYHVGSFFIPATRLYACGVAVAVLGALWLLLTKTWLGRAIRASAQNREGARLMGIDVTAVAALTFALGAGTTGAGGSLISILYPFFPSSQNLWISRVLGIIVLGGMGSLSGALIGALLMGVAESLVSTYISTQWTTAVPYMVIVVVLLLRPQGLFGRRTREDVAVAHG
jgi:branched-chain amino acid transport system permease protein